MTRLLTTAAILIASMARPVAGQDADVQAREAGTLRQLTQQRFDAAVANDRAFYERLLAPHFRLIDPAHFPPVTKRAYLDAEFPPNRAPRGKSTIAGFEAEVSGDSATVSYEVTEPYPLGDLTFVVQSRRLDTYVRSDRAWRLLSPKGNRLRARKIQ